MASTPLIKWPDVTIGDRFDQAVQFTDNTQNFTTIGVTSSIRMGVPPYTNPAFTFTPVISFPGSVNTFVATISMTGTQTDTLAVGSYVGDMILSMAGYGPYTALSFTFNIVPVVTVH